MARIDREQLGELLSGYIDGELDPRERQVIERVLREDESARQLLADLQRTAQAVSSLPRHAAPVSVAADIQAALERTALLNDFPAPRAHQTRGRSSWVARLAMAAMVGLVVLTGWWYTAEQSRRERGAQVAQNMRDVREADVAKEKGEVSTGVEKSALARASRAKEVPTSRAPISDLTMNAVSDAGRSAGAAVATVEQQLAAGVEPSSLRSQSFAAEPVRLQVTVRDRTEREAVVTKIASALSSQRLDDLDTASSLRADATTSGSRFYYRGKSGVNFKDSNEDQFLVRASPQQIDRLLTDLAEPGRSSESVAMVAGPIAVQGIEKSRYVLQLLGEAKRSDELLLDGKNAAADADRATQDQSKGPTGGMLGGLLKIVGIDPKLLSSGAKSAAESDGPSAEPAAVSVASDEPGLPSPPPLVERRLREVTGSGRGSVGKDDRHQGGEESPETNVTVVVQIIEQPKPSQPAKKNPDPPPARKAAE